LALTQYRACAKRGDVPKSLIGGVIVHDHFKPYLKLAGVAHSFCNARHLRELKALIEIEREPWATKMFRLLRRSLAAVHQAVAQNKTSLAERTARRINIVDDSIIEKGFVFHQRQPALEKRTGARGRPPRRTGQNLLIRLRDYKAEVLRFIADFAVPFTNNLAEQGIRMMKVKMKISGGFRPTIRGLNHQKARVEYAPDDDDARGPNAHEHPRLRAAWELPFCSQKEGLAYPLFL
jgi:transposase